jgi:hypothetical protein
VSARAVAVCAVLAVLAGAETARADEAEGRRHWKLGQELYAQKRFMEAAHEFEAGYAVAPRPLFLLNIGHAYRRANELTKAKSAYEALLRLQPDLPQRAEVEGYIKSIDDVLQARDVVPPLETQRPPPLAPAPAPPPPIVRPSVVRPPALVPAPLPAPEAVPEPLPPPVYIEARETSVERKQPESTSLLRKPWFWVLTGAVVAGGVAVAIIASRPSSSCPGTICIHE